MSLILQSDLKFDLLSCIMKPKVIWGGTNIKLGGPFYGPANFCQAQKASKYHFLSYLLRIIPFSRSAFLDDDAFILRTGFTVSSKPDPGNL